MLVRATPTNGFRALTLTTRLISTRLTPKWTSAATVTWAKRSAAASTSERLDRRARDDRRDRQHRGVVGDADRRPVLEQLHDRRGEADDDAGLPAVDRRWRRCRRRSRARRRPCRCRRAAPDSARPASRPRAGPRSRRASPVRRARGRTRPQPPLAATRPSSPTGRTTAVSREGVLAPALMGSALPAPGEKLPTPRT